MKFVEIRNRNNTHAQGVCLAMQKYVEIVSPKTNPSPFQLASYVHGKEAHRQKTHGDNQPFTIIGVMNTAHPGRAVAAIHLNENRARRSASG